VRLSGAGWAHLVGEEVRGMDYV